MLALLDFITSNFERQKTGKMASEETECSGKSSHAQKKDRVQQNAINAIKEWIDDENVVRYFPPPGCDVSTRPGTGNWLIIAAKVVGIASEAEVIEILEADAETCCCRACRLLPRAVLVLQLEADDAQVLALTWVLLLVIRFSA